MRDSEIEQQIDLLFDRFGRMTDTELVLMRSIWEEMDSTAREDAWVQVKVALRKHRRQQMLEEARTRLARFLTAEMPPVGILGVANLPSNPSGMSMASVRSAAMPPLMDALAATVAADGIDAAAQTLLLEPIIRLARHDPERGATPQ
jgi:hypothetical protein